MSKDTAFLVIDVQVGLIEPAYQGQEVLEHINTLLTKARTTQTPVIYVQHDGPPGHGLAVGTLSWQIHPAIAPQIGEIIVHKQASDSFHNTTLRAELDKHGIKHMVVAGGQTEYCVDTTVRRATTCGYDVTLVGDAHTTNDADTLSAAQIIAFYNETLNGYSTGPYTILVKPTRAITF